VTPGECTAVIEIHNGGAVPAHLLPTLFEPFRQTRSRGLGLGLFIAQEVARAHGGEITAESSEESGTTMRVRIPSEGVRVVPRAIEDVTQHLDS
jgi:signal transduction histidine kinase